MSFPETSEFLSICTSEQKIVLAHEQIGRVFRNRLFGAYSIHKEGMLLDIYSDLVSEHYGLKNLGLTIRVKHFFSETTQDSQTYVNLQLAAQLETDFAKKHPTLVSFLKEFA